MFETTNQYIYNLLRGLLYGVIKQKLSKRGMILQYFERMIPRCRPADAPHLPEDGAERLLSPAVSYHIIEIAGIYGYN